MCWYDWLELAGFLSTIAFAIWYFVRDDTHRVVVVRENHEDISEGAYLALRYAQLELERERFEAQQEQLEEKKAEAKQAREDLEYEQLLRRHRQNIRSVLNKHRD
jgi:hypothetical protein